MNWPLAAIVALSWLSAFVYAAEPQRATKSYQDIGRNLVILGQTGLPIGEEIVVRGVKGTRAKGPVATLEVETVNGRKLVTILDSPAIAHWPDGTKVTLRGREVGRLAFRYAHQGGLSAEKAAMFQPHQDITLEFVPDEIVEPRELKLRSRPPGKVQTPGIGHSANGSPGST